MLYSVIYSNKNIRKYVVFFVELKASPVNRERGVSVTGWELEGMVANAMSL